MGVRAALLDWPGRLEDGLFRKSCTMAWPWGPVLRALRYPAALIRDLFISDLNVRAMSLAYTTLLSIVPLLVFSMSILKGLGARNDLKYLLQQFLRPMGRAAEPLTTSILQFVANMSGDLLGSLGLLFLVYTVINTIQLVESSFNVVWRVQKPRSMARRFTEYLSAMVIGPLLLTVAIGFLGSAEHSPFAQWLDALPPLAWAMTAIGHLVPYLVVTAVFTFLYVFVPNTHVELHAALIGGITAGVIWAVVGEIFTHFILYSSQMVAIYTGFAVVLCLFIWVYMSWLILLIGAQFAFYVQLPQNLRHGQQPVELTGAARERASLAVMFLIGRDFSRGGSQWTCNSLATQLEIPGVALAPVLSCLERAGLLVATTQERWLPARDVAGISLVAVIEAVRGANAGPAAIDCAGVPSASSTLHELDAAIQARLGSRSLKDLIDGKTGA